MAKKTKANNKSDYICEQTQRQESHNEVDQLEKQQQLNIVEADFLKLSIHGNNEE